MGSARVFVHNAEARAPDLCVASAMCKPVADLVRPRTGQRFPRGGLLHALGTLLRKGTCLRLAPHRHGSLRAIFIIACDAVSTSCGLVLAGTSCPTAKQSPHSAKIDRVVLLLESKAYGNLQVHPISLSCAGGTKPMPSYPHLPKCRHPGASQVSHGICPSAPATIYHLRAWLPGSFDHLRTCQKDAIHSWG